MQTVMHPPDLPCESRPAHERVIVRMPGVRPATGRPSTPVSSATEGREG